MKVKKIIGIGLLVIGVVGFFYFANQKDERKVFNERISKPEKTVLDVNLQENQTYKIKFWGVDEEMIGVFQQPHFEARLEIQNSQDQVLFNQELVSIHEIESGGKRVTHDGLEYLYIPDEGETIKIIVDIKKGDYIDVDVYENLDSEADAMPGISIILALVGLVIFLRSRKKS